MTLVCHSETRATDATYHRQPLLWVEAYADLAALREQRQVSAEVIQRCEDIRRKRQFMLLRFLEAALVPVNVVERHYAIHGRLSNTARRHGTHDVITRRHGLGRNGYGLNMFKLI